MKRLLTILMDALTYCLFDPALMRRTNRCPLCGEETGPDGSGVCLTCSGELGGGG